MHHGFTSKEGFIVEQDGREYYLMKHIGCFYESSKYLALWVNAYDHELCLSYGLIYVKPDDIVCHGKIIYDDGSERESWWLNVNVFDMND